MPRINVDDDLFIDPRFKALVRCVGNEDQAVGMCVRFWRLALRCWGRDQGLVPEKQFALENLDLLIDLDLAERREGGVYARGSERFSWIVQKMDAARRGGLASAESRRKKFGTAQPNTNPEQPEHTSNTSSNDPERHLVSVRRTPNPLPLPLPLCSKEQRNPLTPLEGDEAAEESGSSHDPSPKVLAELWNDLKSSKQRSVNLGMFTSKSNRWRQARSQLAAFPNLDDWREAFRRIADSDFCNGNNDRGWIADFDFVLRKDTLPKALEGKYDNPKAKSPAKDPMAAYRLTAKELETL